MSKIRRAKNLDSLPSPSATDVAIGGFLNSPLWKENPMHFIGPEPIGPNYVEQSAQKVALLIEKFPEVWSRRPERNRQIHPLSMGPGLVACRRAQSCTGIPDWVKQVPISGIIARIDGRQTAKELLRLGRPVIDVRASVRSPQIPAFVTNPRMVAQMVADFFLRAGFRHFGYCELSGNSLFRRPCGAAFADYLATRGYTMRQFSPPRQDLARTSRSASAPLTLLQAAEQRGLESEKAVAAWLLKQPRPFALFACNDICGQQVLNACREYGINVPGEVAVMGVDDDEVLCTISEPPLSSIKPDTEQISIQAAELLDAMMRGKAVK